MVVVTARRGGLIEQERVYHKSNKMVAPQYLRRIVLEFEILGNLGARTKSQDFLGISKHRDIEID